MTADSTTVSVQGGVALVEETLEPFELGEIRIRDGRIDRITGGAPAPADTVIEADGCFVVPGLVDAHVHLDLPGGRDPIESWRLPAETRGLIVWWNGLRALAAGITAVRDLGSSDESTIRFADLVRGGRALAPRIRACGRMIMQTGGHAWEVGRQADGPDDVRRAVREQVRAGADLIKVMASAGFSTPGNVQCGELSVPELEAAVEEAHRAGLPIAAHAHATAGIQACLEAGVDTIEHGAFLADDQITEMASRSVPLVPTLRAVEVIRPDAGLDPNVVAKVAAGRDAYLDSIRRAIAAGVPIAAGTDAGTSLNHHGGLVDELETYVQLGMSPSDALRSATVVAGQLAGFETGVIAAGRPADVIVVEGDPREDVGALRTLRAVIAAGTPVDIAWAHASVTALRPPDGLD